MVSLMFVKGHFCSLLSTFALLLVLHIVYVVMLVTELF